MPVSALIRVSIRLAVLMGSATLIAGILLGPLPARASSASRALQEAIAVLSAPVEPLDAVRLFDRPATPYGPGHRGVDLEAAAGQLALSPGPGVVTFAGTVVDRGVVSVAHPGGLISSVEPVVPGVAVGDVLVRGTPLGLVSDEAGHCAPTTCLHWGVRRGGVYLNPLDVLMGFGPVRLLPLDATGSGGRD